MPKGLPLPPVIRAPEASDGQRNAEICWHRACLVLDVGLHVELEVESREEARLLDVRRIIVSTAPRMKPADPVAVGTGHWPSGNRPFVDSELRGRQADLLQVIDALGPTGRLAGRLHGRQLKCDQDRDDGNHHEKLD